MPTGAAAKAKQFSFPVKLATIKIHDQSPSPKDLVVVATKVGKVQFKNADEKEYRIRIWRKDTDEKFGIELVLPHDGTTSFTVQTDQEFHYSVLDKAGDAAAGGRGGGPIKFETLESVIGRGGGPIK
jgi:hypothetical protein